MIWIDCDLDLQSCCNLGYNWDLAPFSISFMARRGFKPTANSLSGLKPTGSIVAERISSRSLAPPGNEF